MAYSYYEELLLKYNWTGNGNWDNNGVSTQTTQLPNTGLNASGGTYSIGYNFLIDANSLELAGYYDTPLNDLNSDLVFDPEYDYFRATTTGQKDILEVVMGVDTSYDYAYSVFFSDVAKINFTASTPQYAEILIGQSDGASPEFVQPSAGIIGYVKDYDPVTQPTEEKYGDLWINEDFTLGWSDTDEGTAQFWGLMHEVGHSLGLDDLTSSSSINSQKYSIMSVVLHDSMDYGSNNAHDASDVYRSNLGLYDVAALQEIYGANTATRAGNTTYKEGQGFAASVNDAFMYTIWDGAGTDTIDASAYADGVTIDLRDGHFSSIGKAADSSYAGTRGTGLADDNVAIAFNAEIENATGTSESDTLIGNDLVNTLSGGAGIDTIEGGLGNDILDGGAGQDTYIYNLGDDHDTISEVWSETNTISFGSGIAIGSIGIEQTVNDVIISHDSSYILTLANVDASVAQNLNLQFSDGTTNKIKFSDSRTFIGNSTDEILVGGSGNNNIAGQDGNDIIHGGDGNDNISGQGGDDIMYGGSGNDTLGDALGYNKMYGGSGDDTYNYYSQQDWSFSQNTILDSSGVNDSIRIFAVDQYEVDQIVFSVLDDGSLLLNLDALAYSNSSTNYYYPDLTIDKYFVSADSIESLVVHETPTSSNLISISLSSLLQDFVVGSELVNDDLDGNASDNTMHGLSGNDDINGAGGNDNIDGGLGNDVLDGGDGDDTLIGGAGADTLDGGTGIDTADYSATIGTITANLSTGTATGDGADTLSGIENLIGGSGNDVFTGDASTNVLNGNAGQDTLSGGAGNDTLNGGDDNDTLNGNDGDDILNGGAGADYLWGHAGNDTLNGDEGGDVLTGGADNDTLYGGDDSDVLFGDGNSLDESTYTETGSDTLIGNGGNDYMYGGRGNDFLYGDDQADVLYGGSGNDYLEGRGEDDTLYGDGGPSYSYTGNDELNGGAGQDDLYGQNGHDILWAGEGADLLYGGAGSDTFAIYEVAGLDNDMAFAMDFVEADDAIDISALLTGYDPLTDAITDFVNIAQGGNTTIQVDRDGTGTAHGWDNVIRIQGNSTMDTDVNNQVADGTLLVA